MRRLMKMCSLAVTFIMLLAIALAGCGSAETDKETSKAAVQTSADAVTTAPAAEVAWDKNKKDKIVVSVINMYYTAGEKKLAEEYMKLHPETEVQIEVLADNSTYMTNFSTKISTDKNQAPDIVHWNIAIGTKSPTDAVNSGWLMDIAPVLDEINPYNDNKKVREAFREDHIKWAMSGGQGKLLHMPFDEGGTGIYYNKTIFEKNGLKVPATYEELIELCKKLQELGYKNPIAASGVATWYVTSLADWAYRSNTADFLTLPGDALYDEAAMKENTSIKFDANDPNFDRYAMFNTEKLYAFAKKNGFNTPTNKMIQETYINLAKYFQPNWTSPDDNKVSVDFITQNSPMMWNGSWIVGKFVDDVKKLPADKQFQWGTFQVPGFANPAAPFQGNIRSLDFLANAMGIVPKDDKDHMSRVIDFYKYWYSPNGAKMCYEETLASGNYVQGPCVIEGVTLPDELNSYLEGFKTDGAMRFEFQDISGNGASARQADLPALYALYLDASAGKITIDQFMTEASKLWMLRLDELIAQANLDLDPKTKDEPKK